MLSMPAESAVTASERSSVVRAYLEDFDINHRQRTVAHPANHA